MNKQFFWGLRGIFFSVLLLTLFYGFDSTAVAADASGSPSSANKEENVQINPPESQEKKRDLSDPVATVNGVKITAMELKMAFDQRIPEIGHGSISRNRMAEISLEVLGGLILQEILYQEAVRQKIKVNPADVEAELKKIRGRFGSEKDYLKALETQSLKREDLRAGVERHLAVQKLSEQEIRSRVAVSDEAMQEYYNEHPDKFQRPPQVRLRLLLVHVDPSAGVQKWEEGRLRTQAYADQVRDGEDFEKLILEFSEEPNAEATLGDTGLLHQGRLPYVELEPLVFNQGLGVISDPVQTLYGYVVYRVEEKMPAEQLAFENLNKDLLRQELERSQSEEKFKEWVNDLEAKAEIKLY